MTFRRGSICRKQGQWCDWRRCSHQSVIHFRGMRSLHGGETRYGMQLSTPMSQWTINADSSVSRPSTEPATATSRRICCWNTRLTPLPACRLPRSEQPGVEEGVEIEAGLAFGDGDEPSGRHRAEPILLRLGAHDPEERRVVADL